MGKVIFVSAGPGDPDLLTLRGAKALGEAGAVLFDDLCEGVLADHVNPLADLVAVGKRAGKHSARQEIMGRLLVDYAAQMSVVVRLKAGDCAIFGRLEEEIALLDAHGIEYEIIPGVTAACAAAAAHKIPLTRRIAARRLQFVTGHAADGELPTDLDIAAIADPTTVTALYMGARTFAQLWGRLSDIGVPPSWPVALSFAMGGSKQELVKTTMAGAEQHLSTRNGQACLILIGPLLERK